MGTSRRVVVTGLGAVTPLGATVSETWNALIEGKSGAGPVTLFDSTDCPCRIAAEVKNFNAATVMNPKEARKIGRFAQLSVAASKQAYEDSGLALYREKIEADRIGVNIGVGIGGLPEIQDVYESLLKGGYKRVTPFFILQAIPNMASGQVSIELNLKGVNLCSVTACASSAHSIGESFRAIQRGDADIMLAGGAESVIGKLAFGGFCSLRALTTRNDAPAQASRPYDQGRDGFLMGEGAATLVLEEYELAKSRGAKIYAELTGYGLSSDAYHSTMPAPEGEGGGRAMLMALKSAGLNPNEIGYINTHGTSTPAGDPEEVRAIARVFQNCQKSTDLSSTKSMTGHLLGGAGAVESIFSILALRESVIPPTINLESIDPVCAEFGFSFTPNASIQKKLNHVLSNSFGFGGTNGCLIFSRI